MRKLFMLVLMLLAGCTTFDNTADPSRLNLETRPANSAVVVISTGALAPCVSSASALWIVQLDGGNESNVTNLNIDWSGIKSDFADHQGSINAIYLPAGNYRMIPKALNPMASPIKVPEATFSLAAGEAIYLGEYYMPVSCSLSNRVIFRDKRERDLALAIGKNPNLSAMNFVTRIPEFTKP